MPGELLDAEVLDAEDVLLKTLRWMLRSMLFELPAALVAGRTAAAASEFFSEIAALWARLSTAERKRVLAGLDDSAGAQFALVKPSNNQCRCICSVSWKFNLWGARPGVALGTIVGTVGPASWVADQSGTFCAGAGPSGAAMVHRSHDKRVQVKQLLSWLQQYDEDLTSKCQKLLFKQSSEQNAQYLTWAVSF
eukprot:3519973-Amphidinium_carterae.1